MKARWCAFFHGLTRGVRAHRSGLIRLFSLFCLPGLLCGIVAAGAPQALAADALGNAPLDLPVVPDDPPFEAWVPGALVPGLVPEVVLLPGAVLPGAEPGMVVPQVKLPDGTVSPGLVGPEGKVVPAVIDQEGTLVPGLINPEGLVVPAVMGPDNKLVPAAIGPEGKLIPASLLPVVPVVPGVPVVPVVPGQVLPPALTPADFLLREKDLGPGTPPKAQAEAAPAKKSDPVKKAEAEKTPEPVKKAEVPKEEPRKQVAKGQPLRIPEEARRTGDLSFLEGCWRGYRPEYRSKRMVTERFCFDASGKGRRTIIDPTKTGLCTTATRALINSGGVLKVQSDAGYCINGVKWNQSVMTCRGSGANTPCTWVFGPKDSQSYTISLVRD